MLKRWFLVGVMLLLAALLVGCFGVPKEDYEAVVTERDSALAELQSVKSQLNSVQAEALNLEAEVSNLEAEVSNLEAEASDLSSELEQKQQQLSEFQPIFDSLEPKLQMQQLLAEFCNKLLWYKLPKGPFTWSEFWSWASRTFRFDMENHLEAVDDTALHFLYEDAFIWGTDAVTTYYDEIDELLTRLDKLIEADKDELQAVLAD